MILLATAHSDRNVISMTSNRSNVDDHSAIDRSAMDDGKGHCGHSPSAGPSS